ncbi:MAG: cupin domain-containing protein [Cyanobacteria bacterium SZAS LIN-2]|nr:cupin domain-containing protein [Cyanobacteria bacterium SZAS LIN-2]
MADTTITKIDSRHSPRGAAGQKYLACGKSMSMRLWEDEKVNCQKQESKHDYETVGYVIKGKAELHMEGQMVVLNAGDSWVVPKGATHCYKILEEFSALETTSPPAELHDRAESDRAPGIKEYVEASSHDADAVQAPQPVKTDSPDMKARANTESQGDAEAKPELGEQVGADGKPIK